jgi:hypothetical protein
MNLLKFVAAYRRLRGDPLWRLLAADNAPILVALLQTNLMDGDGKLPASLLYERLTRDIEDLRTSGEVLPQTAQAYVMNWLAEGWLTRRFPAGASEEEYELSADAVRAIRMIRDLVQPRTVATESRLSVVIQLLVYLADATDTDQKRRLDSLLAERERINHKIQAVRQGRLNTLTEERAIEQAREIIALAGELAADFHNVRDHFDQLNRELRERIMEESDSRGSVLGDLFAGIDVIAASDSGRTFYSFWRLLTDPEQNATLEESVDAVCSRDFSERLNFKERRFLQGLIRTLVSQGGVVHEVLQSFARSLKQFVQSREYLEQRLINQRIREAQRAALEARHVIRSTDKMDFQLELTSSPIRSISQWVVYDPAANAIKKGMAYGDAVEIDLETISSLVAHSEIDFRTLRNNIRTCLQAVSQVSIRDVMDRYPAGQGLGSVVGYLVLGSRSGIRSSEKVEMVYWTGEDGFERRAHIPIIHFLRDRIHELA